MEKDVEVIVERHCEAAFQQGFVMGFGLAFVSAIVGLCAFAVWNWWK